MSKTESFGSGGYKVDLYIQILDLLSAAVHWTRMMELAVKFEIHVVMSCYSFYSKQQKFRLEAK